MPLAGGSNSNCVRHCLHLFTGFCASPSASLAPEHGFFFVQRTADVSWQSHTPGDRFFSLDEGDNARTSEFFSDFPVFRRPDWLPFAAEAADSPLLSAWLGDVEFYAQSASGSGFCSVATPYDMLPSPPSVFLYMETARVPKLLSRLTVVTAHPSPVEGVPYVLFAVANNSVLFSDKRDAYQHSSCGQRFHVRA
jgi:hypothetical protein